MTEQPTRDQLRALADAATPGPWWFDDLDGGTYLKPPATGAMLVSYGAGIEQQRRDAEFIAAARTAIPQLLDQLEQAEAELDSWMTRAYEAEKRAWQAEARIRAVGDVLDKAESLYVGAVNPKYRAVHIADIRRALESVPPPSA